MVKSKKSNKGYIYFRKVIPIRFRKSLDGLNEFKISLKDIEKNHLRGVKGALELTCLNILNNINDFDKESSVQYLNITLNEALVKIYGLTVPQHKDLSLKKKSEVITLEEGVERYITYKTEVKQVGQGTLDNYSLYKKLLFDFFDKDIDVEEITEDQVEQYQLKLLRTRGNNGTNNVMAFPKGLYTYLISKKIIIENVFKSVEDMRSTQSDKEAFTNSEIKLLLDNCENNDIRFTLKMAFYTGFRLSEIFFIKVEDVDIKNGFIYCKLKDTTTKKHTRIIPIHPELKSDIENILKCAKSGRLVFNTNKKVTKTLGTVVNQYIRSKINSKSKTLHSTRHSFSKQIENYGLKDIKILLGHFHKDITVQAYLNSDTNWNKKIEMINQIDYSNTEISELEAAINKMKSN